MWVVSEELVRMRRELTTELAIGRNSLQTMAEYVQQLAAENDRLVAKVRMGDRMTADLKSARVHLQAAFDYFSQASQMALGLNVLVEIPDPPSSATTESSW